MTEPSTSELVHRLSQSGATERQKSKARRAAQAFLRKHGIVRPDCPCLKSLGVHMHHPNYAEPLKVMFLCERCHVLEHTPGRGTWGEEFVHDLKDLIPPPARSSDIFTPTQIKTIRRRYAAAPTAETVRELADAFVVTVATIRAIVLIKRWRHVR